MSKANSEEIIFLLWSILAANLHQSGAPMWMFGTAIFGAVASFIVAGIYAFANK